MRHQLLHSILTLPSALGQVEMMHNTTLRDGSNLNDYWNNKEVQTRTSTL